jgi:hypothetical protein
LVACGLHLGHRWQNRGNQEYRRSPEFVKVHGLRVEPVCGDGGDDPSSAVLPRMLRGDRPLHRQLRRAIRRDQSNILRDPSLHIGREAAELLVGLGQDLDSE